jgi:hypothetical protein
MRQAIAVFQASGAKVLSSHQYYLLASSYLDYGDLRSAADVLAKGFEHLEATWERFYEPALLRLKARLVAEEGDEQTAMTCLRRAVEVAQQFGQKLMQDRAEADLRTPPWRKRGPT